MLPTPPASVTTSTRRSSAFVPPPERERDYAPAAWQHPQAALSGVLPQQQPFRHDDQPGTTLVWLPDEDDELVPHRVEEAQSRRGENLYIGAGELLHEVALTAAPGVSRWGLFDLPSLLNEHAEALDRPLGEIARKFTTVEVPRSDLGWRWHSWLGFIKNR